MGSRPDASPPVPPASYRFLTRSLAWLRWVTVAALVLLMLAQPAVDRTVLPHWALPLLFGAYTLLFDRVKNRLPWLAPFTWEAILDLLVASLIYFLGGEPGGPLRILFFLALVCAVASMTLRAGLVYTAFVAVAMSAIDLALAGWSPTAENLREVGARLILLALFGIGMAVLARRLVLEQEAAQLVRGEAQRLEELDRLRADFVSSVSHELRTPLTSARAGLGMLETSGVEQLRPDQREVLTNARGSIESLGILIDDLLTLNQLEAGALHLDREPVDLRAVVTDALSAAHPMMQEKGQVLEVDLPELLPVEGDPRRLEHVVVNLMANAHWHTPTGTRVEISGRVVAGEVLLSISDNGPGIPSGELEAIFRRFYRVGSGEEGSGLGLAIAKNIVELHGGRIWAESRPAEGAAFHVALPQYRSGGER